MKDTTCDRIVINAALLAPLALIVLGKWRSSLETAYVPTEPGMAQVFGAAFQDKAAQWLRAEPGEGARLVLVVDRECPCTRSTRAALDAALTSSSRRDVALSVRDVADISGDAAWNALLGEVPATPTLLAVDHGQLAYAGPVNGGSWCTTSVNQVLGLAALQTPGEGALLNWLGEGCYCRLRAR